MVTIGPGSAIIIGTPGPAKLEQRVKTRRGVTGRDEVNVPPLMLSWVMSIVPTC